MHHCLKWRRFICICSIKVFHFRVGFHSNRWSILFRFMYLWVKSLGTIKPLCMRWVVNFPHDYRFWFRRYRCETVMKQMPHKISNDLPLDNFPFYPTNVMIYIANRYYRTHESDGCTEEKGASWHLPGRGHILHKHSLFVQLYQSLALV